MLTQFWHPSHAKLLLAASLDSRFSVDGLAMDMIDVLAAMAKAALDANAAGGSTDFEKAMVAMTSGEKQAFQSMQTK